MTFPLAALKRYARVIGGSTPTPDETNWDGEINWLTPADVSPCHGGEVWESARTLSAQGLASCSASLAPAGSVVVTTRAPIGNVAVTRTPSATNQGCRTLVPDHRLDARYLRYQLQVRTEELQSQGAGSTFRELSGSALGVAQVRVPGLGQQHAIADFLDRECERIAALDAACEAQLSTLEQHAARVHDEMLAAEGSVPLKVLLRDSCVGIVVQPARLYVADGEVPCLRAVNVQAGEIVREDLQRISRGSHEANARSELQAGDVVVVRSGQAGAAAVVPDWAIGANCVDLLVLRPGPACESNWLVEVLNSEAFMGEVKRLTVGTIQGHMNLSVVRRIHCPAQAVREQVQVVERIQAARAETRAMRGELIGVRRLLLEYRDALITEAITGKLDVTRLSESQFDESARAAVEDERPEVHA